MKNSYHLPSAGKVRPSGFRGKSKGLPHLHLPFGDKMSSWWDASVLRIAGPLAAWKNRAGMIKDLTLTQATDARRPTVVLNAKNGNSVVRFNGSNSMSILSGVSQLMLLGQNGGTVTMVVRQNVSSSSPAIYRCSGTGSVIAFYNRFSGWNFIDWGNAGDTNGRLSYATNEWFDWEVYHIIRRRFELEVWRGPVLAFSSAYTGSTLANVDSSLTIGFDNPSSAPSSAFNGDIGELRFYNRPLTDTERKEELKFLLRKWGISYPAAQADAFRTVMAMSSNFGFVNADALRTVLVMDTTITGSQVASVEGVTIGAMLQNGVAVASVEGITIGVMLQLS